MNNLTLTYSGTTKTLAEWGFAEPMLKLNSRSPSTFKVRMPGSDPTAADAIPYLGQVTVTDTDLGGGTVIFKGRLTNKGNSAGRETDAEIVFSDAWWDLEKGIYLTTWKTTTDGTTYTSYKSPRAWLFMNIGSGGTAWTKWSTAAQATDIINFASSFYGSAIQAGTIDPLVTMVVYPVTSQTMAECLNILFESQPDVYTFFDYTTTPPTLHCRQRKNLTGVTKAWGDGSHTSDISSRDDLQIPQVVVNYQTASSSTGYSLFSSDAYPIGSTGNALQSLNLQFDLRGGSVKTQSAAVHSTAIDVTNATFWKTEKPDLASADIVFTGFVDSTVNGGGGHPQGITVKDATTGADVSLSSYPNRLEKDSAVASWMTLSGGGAVVVKEVVVTGYLIYYKVQADGVTPADNLTQHRVDAKIKVTNSPAGAQTYTTLASSYTSETAPPNFAYLLWCSLNNVAVNLVSGVVTPPSTAPTLTNPENLHWEGTHEIVADSIAAYYSPKNTLSLSGGKTAWSTMKAAIHTVEFDFTRGTTRISFGPHKVFSPAQFWDLAMMARTRIMWDNPNIPSSGSDSAATSNVSPGDTELRNTTEHSAPDAITKSVVGPVASGKYWVSSMDAGSSGPGMDATPGWLVVKRANTSIGGAPGVIDTSVAAIKAFISQLPAGSVVQFRQIKSLQWDAGSSTFLPKVQYILSTSPADDTAISGSPALHTLHCCLDGVPGTITYWGTEFVAD